MNARRLRWRGPAQQARIGDELERQLGLWLQGWSVESGWLSLSATDTGALGEYHWLHAQSGDANAWIGMPRAALSRLGARLAAVDGEQRNDLGERLGRRAMQSLLAQWLGNESANIAEAAPTPADMQARFGSMRFNLQGRDFAASVVLDAGACDRIAPMVPSSKSSALCARADALGKEALELQVRLALGDALLGDAHALRVGDVLVSGTRVDSLFDLVHENSRPLASGHLRRHDRRLAFALQAAAPTSRKQA